MDDYASLREKLDAVKGDALKKAERKALRSVGKLVQNAVKQRAPIQSGEYAAGVLAPGELSASIKARVHVADDTAVGDTSSVTVGPTGSRVIGIATAVEFGHANPRAKRGLANTPAHPFVRPAFDATSEEAVDTYEEIMTAEIKAALE